MIIHVEPEQLAAVAYEMAARSRKMEEAAEGLRRRQIALESAWQGGSAEDFHSRARRATRRLLDAAEDLRILALRLQRAAEMWYLLDARGRERWYFDPSDETP